MTGNRILKTLSVIILFMMASDVVHASFQPAKLIVKVAPKYPREAFLNNTEGYVSVIFVVNAEGKAEDIEVIDEHPQRTFRKAALKALRKWRFSPAKENGEVVTDVKEITIDFKIH